MKTMTVAAAAVVLLAYSMTVAADDWRAFGSWSAFDGKSKGKPLAGQREAAGPRQTRIVWIGATWCGPCNQAHGVFEASAKAWMEKGGWEINGTPSAHVQIVDYDSRPQWCGAMLKGDPLPWVGVVKFDDRGEPVEVLRRLVGPQHFNSKTVLLDLNSGKIGKPTGPTP